MTHTLRRNARLLLGSDPETSPLLRLIGTVLLAFNLLYNHRGPVPLWLWIIFGAAFACWLVYALCEDNRHRLAAGALIGCALLSAVSTGKWPDPANVSAPVIQLWVAVSLLAQQIVVRTKVVLSIGAATAGVLIVSCLLAGLTASHILTALGAGVHRPASRAVPPPVSAAGVPDRAPARADPPRPAGTRARRGAGRARPHRPRDARRAGAFAGRADRAAQVAEGLLSEKGDVTAALTHLRRSHRLALDGLTEARGAVAALREDVPPLPEAVRGLVESYRRDHRLTVECLVDGEARALPSAAVVPLLRVAREALTNAAKHAPGAPATVTLTFTPDRVRLSVRNPMCRRCDSGGASRAADGGGGYGLPDARAYRIGRRHPVRRTGRDGRDWQVTAEVPE